MPETQDNAAVRTYAISISATALNIDTNESQYEVAFVDIEGRSQTCRIGREVFQHPGKVVEILLKAHADLPLDPKQAAALVLDAMNRGKGRTIHVTSRTGRHGRSFVYPTKTFGEEASVLVHEGASGLNAALGQSQGTHASWSDGLSKAFAASDYLVFAASVAAASVLLSILRGKNEGALFHFHGTSSKDSSKHFERTKSSSGKTLAARVGMSTIGRCEKTDLATLAITERAIEDYCFAHNHLLVVLDEEGRAGGRTAACVDFEKLAYIIPSGVGTVRSKRATRDADLKNRTWGLFGISTGEEPLDERSTRARPEGAQLRMISIPVPPGARGGIFNCVKGSSAKCARKCKKLAQQVEATIEASYGKIIPELLRHIYGKAGTKLERQGRRASRLVEKFIQRKGADDSPWERRYAEKFGLVYAAAHILSKLGVVPWSIKRAWIATSRVYDKARERTVSVEEAADALRQRLRRLVEAGKRFPEIRESQKFPSEAASAAWGCIRKLPRAPKALLIPRKRAKRLVAPASLGDAVLSRLTEQKTIFASKQMLLKTLHRKRRRYLCIDLRRLGSN